MKKFITVCAFFFSLSLNIFAEGLNVEGEKTFQPILLNQDSVEIGSYLIEERNYLKLRDVAALLNDTNSQFNVDWDEATGYVIIETCKSYQKQTNDLLPLPDGKVSGVKGNINLLLNGELRKIETVLINENNYLQLRQLGSIAGFGVDWDEKTSAVLITTNEEAPKLEEVKSISYNELAKQKINSNEKKFENQDIRDFSINTVDGSKKGVKVGQVLEENKVQLFNFFRTNCPHCINEFPDFVNFNKREDIDIVLVSLDENIEDVKKTFDGDKYPLPVFMATDSDQIIRDYNLQVVPTSAFVKNGKVLGIFEGGLKESQLKFIMDEINSGKAFPSNDTILQK